MSWKQFFKIVYDSDHQRGPLMQDSALESARFDEDEFKVFEYEQGETVAVRRSAEELGTHSEMTVESESDWEELLEQDYFCRFRPKSAGIAAILAARRGQDSKNLDRLHNSATLEYLPFSQRIFELLAIQMPIHKDIARIINRSDAPIFAEMNLDVPDAPICKPTSLDEYSAYILGAYQMLVYFFRTSSAWPGDMGMAGTFHRESGFTSCIVFGCDEEKKESIAARIENSEDASTHPLLMIGILAEIERERHLALVRDKVHALLQRVYSLSNQEQISESSVLAADNYSVDSWIGVSQLRSGLETWKEQLQKMIAHVAELEIYILSTTKPVKQIDNDPSSLSRGNWRKQCIQTGRRIKKRLLEIVSEYDERIRQCSIVIDGVTLATQMSWNRIGFQDAQANLKIAMDTHQDSGQMRSIALLTMIFLPGTFVASFFSTGFFNWEPSDGEKVLSPYIWIYPAATVALTVLVFVGWYISRRAKKKDVLQEKSMA